MAQRIDAQSRLRRSADEPTPEYESAGFFAVRTPLLSFDESVVAEFSLSAPAAWRDGQDLTAAVTKDAAIVRARIAELLQCPEVEEALFVASPDLAQSLPAWRENPESERGRRVERSLMKYLTRMSTRGTPFGLLAGCSVGTIGEVTELCLARRMYYRRHTRLDMDYLSLLVENLVSNLELRRELRFRPNSSIYRVGDRLHAIETRMLGRNRQHHLVAFDVSCHLISTLSRAAGGSRLDELAAGLVDEEIDPDDAFDYVNQLVENQLLISELEPSVTGDEPIHALIEVLSRTRSASEVAVRLEQVRDRLEAIDSGGIGCDSEEYHGIARILDGKPVGAELARLFQVDLVKPVERASLSSEVVAEIARGVAWMSRLQLYPPEPLKKFRQAFRERYEDRIVPLFEVLDEEIGVGFGSDRERSESPAAQARLAFLMQRVVEIRSNGGNELVLTDGDMERLAVRASAALPDAFSVGVILGAASPESLASGDYQLAISGVAGPSGARMLGRFCHADTELGTFVEEHLRREEALRPDAILAEVVHLPMGRLGNVICRPVLRQHEIPFLGSSGADAEHQIPVADLLVCLRENRITLISARYGRPVLPRLTNAHNYSASGNLALYRFLCALQSQDGTPPYWDWAELRSLPFLPRVRYGRLTLSSARWRLDAADLEPLGSKSREARFRTLQQMRDRLSLPRLLLLSDGDNQLLVDLDNVLSADAFAALVRKRQGAILTELVPGTSELTVSGPEGAYLHELIVPFSRSTPRASQPQSPPIRLGRAHRRSPPGSEWLYAKVYSGGGVAEQVLREAVAPVVRQLVSEGVVDRWFFLRYADPDPHLRLRFHGSPDALASKALPLLHAALEGAIEENRVWRMQLDTYEPEVERYGGEGGIVVAEQIFSVDSDAVLEILSAFPGDLGQESRRLLGLRGIDDLFGTFGYELTQKIDLLESQVGEPPGPIRRQWSARYRAERPNIERLLSLSVSDSHPLAPGVEILQRRTGRLLPLVQQLEALSRDGTLDRPIERIVFSYTHMFLNRLLRDAVDQERLAYDFLLRAYRSVRARSKSA